MDEGQAAESRKIEKTEPNDRRLWARGSKNDADEGSSASDAIVEVVTVNLPDRESVKRSLQTLSVIDFRSKVELP